MALGTFEFGSRLPDRRCHELLETFTTLGGKLIDTAPTYGRRGDHAFAAETIIGRWLSRTAAPLRVATKAGLDPASGRPNLDSTVLEASAQASRKRLQRPSLDLLWLHRDAPATPLDEIADVLSRLLDEGTVEQVGCSNWQPHRLLCLANILAACPIRTSARRLVSFARRGTGCSRATALLRPAPNDQYS